MWIWSSHLNAHRCLWLMVHVVIMNARLHEPSIVALLVYLFTLCYLCLMLWNWVRVLVCLVKLHNRWSGWSWQKLSSHQRWRRLPASGKDHCWLQWKTNHCCWLQVSYCISIWWGNVLIYKQKSSILTFSVVDNLITSWVNLALL